MVMSFFLRRATQTISKSNLHSCWNRSIINGGVRNVVDSEDHVLPMFRMLCYTSFQRSNTESGFRKFGAKNLFGKGKFSDSGDEDKVFDKMRHGNGSKRFVKKEKVADGTDEDEDDDEPLEKMEMKKLHELGRFRKSKRNPDYTGSKEPEVAKRRVPVHLHRIPDKRFTVPSDGNVISDRKQTALKVTPEPTGVPVRLLRLPKKKNIERDLNAALKEVAGIKGISLTVTGDEKTRDPVCKGFAYVYFMSKGHAERFVETFSMKTITFGKIQKQIMCELANPKPTAPESTITNRFPSSPLPPTRIFKQRAMASPKLRSHRLPSR